MKVTNCLSALLILCISMASCTKGWVPKQSISDVEVPIKRFIAFYFHSYKRGLPEKSQLSELTSFITPTLLNLFDEAIKGEECYAKKFNYEGAPRLQGDLFSSLFEGATSATYRPILTKTDKATYEIEWTNADKRLTSIPFVWKDQVFLVRTSTGWLISDFVHLGTWDFMMKGNVSEILLDVSKECANLGR